VFDNLRVDLERGLECNTDVEARMPSRVIHLALHPGTHAVVVYRFAKWAQTVRIPLVKQLLGLVAFGARYFVFFAWGINLSAGARIGKGLVVHTWSGVFVAPVEIGEYCYVQTGVVITAAVKSVGRNVYFGPGAKIHGHVRIGNNVRVSANSVVARDLPDDCTATGIPARVLPGTIYKREGEGEIFPRYSEMAQ